MSKRTTKCEIYRSNRNGKYYWRVIAANGEIIARSSGGKSGGYVRARDAEISAVKTLNSSMRITRK